MTGLMVLVAALSLGGWLLLVNGLGVHSDREPYEPRHGR